MSTINQGDLTNVKVLVAEDNPLNQAIAKKFLQMWNADLDLAINGEKVLELIDKNHYDVILMDIQMPVLDGFETAKIIRKNKDTYYQNIPIIALTASTMIEEKEKVFNAGMDDFVVKPFVPKKLYDTIIKHIK